MSAPWVVAALGALLVLVAAVAVGAGWAVRRQAARAEAARRDADALRERLDLLERRVAASGGAGATDPRRPTAVVRRPERGEPGEPAPGHVITSLGLEVTEDDDDPDRADRPVVPAPLFADLVLREGVVQVAALAAGVRRALAPEQRHRVRLEMRREVKRARKQRRADLREARRALADRQRPAA